MVHQSWAGLEDRGGEPIMTMFRFSGGLDIVLLSADLVVSALVKASVKT